MSVSAACSDTLSPSLSLVVPFTTGYSQQRSHFGCRGRRTPQKSRPGCSAPHNFDLLCDFWLASKLHNWCIRAILLLFEIRDIGIQVVCELFVYFRPMFSGQNAPKSFSGRALRFPKLLAHFKEKRT